MFLFKLAPSTRRVSIDLHHTETHSKLLPIPAPHVTNAERLIASEPIAEASDRYCLKNCVANWTRPEMAIWVQAEPVETTVELTDMKLILPNLSSAPFDPRYRSSCLSRLAPAVLIHTF